MRKENKKEMLSTIYNSVVGLGDIFKYEETSSMRYKMNRNSDVLEIRQSIGSIKNYEFDITKPEMSLRFSIRISKIKDINLFGRDKSKYITNVRVSDKTSFSSFSNEDIWILSWVDDTLDIQKKIFDIIENKRIKNNMEKEDQKYNRYISELNKSIDKVSSRDDKINDIIK